MNRKPLFDTLRRMLGRGFTRAEVEELDRAADYLSQDSVPCVPHYPSPRAVGPDGIALIKRFEGCAKIRADGMVEAYPDPGTGAEPWTIGWGATGPGIARGTVWTREACDARLEADLARYAAEVADELDGAATSQQQFDALVSFHYNTGAIATATLTRLHKAGDHDGAASEFARWCYAGGRKLKGLARRREAEARLYRLGS
ncbi:lysozyme [Aurantiacibacter sp. MUD11]|uniref:lysozyme n=1 Tax=Aurantiacibacter sp. MUD11 TaxID=3003265 RepID=UPI0022AAD75E|nr:lysozyme [Aurantiacibacter sp. MUD11]WAT19078.1 lysozyme [Aurantiacibacter sp. MUD11]